MVHTVGYAEAHAETFGRAALRMSLDERVGRRWMHAYRRALPQLGGELFLTEVGLETSLIFYDGIDLPCFATFPLLETEDGRRALRAYYQPLLRLARDAQAGFILDTLTWRANADWGIQLGYDAAALAQANHHA